MADAEIPAYLKILTLFPKKTIESAYTIMKWCLKNMELYIVLSFEAK
eukprot:jgi/Antlo1/1654/2175